MRIGPSTADSVLIAVCAIFTALGAWMGSTGELAGWAAAAVSAGGTVLAIRRLERKQMLRANATAESIEVEGHVPIRASQTSVRAIAAGLVLVGGAGALLGDAFGVLFVGLSSFAATAGILLGIGSLLGLLARPFLQFEPTGLRVGESNYSYVLEWNNLADIDAGEIRGEPTLLIRVRDVRRLEKTLETRRTKDWARHTLNRLVATNRRSYRCHLVIVPVEYGTDLALLLHAIRRYSEDPSARRSLEAKLALPG